MKLHIILFFSCFTLLWSCNKVTTTLVIDADVFNKETAIPNASVDIIEVTNIAFVINGKTADREIVNTVEMDGDGKLNFSTDSNFEELEFIVRKDGFIEFRSWDYFTIEQGDDTNLNIEMYEESFIKIVATDVANVSNEKIEVTVLLHPTNNTVHEFSNGDGEIIKLANGDTDNTILVSRDDGTSIPETIFVPTRDTTVYEIIY